MSVSVIIPAHNEEKWLNRTIQNIYDTATGEIEVIVFLNGYTQTIDTFPRTKALANAAQNLGERIAMNAMVKRAEYTHILRIDAHCDFSPKGWDEMMETATGPKDMTQAVLTAVDKEWNRLPGHRYERCRLLPNMEAKWEKPNHDVTYGAFVIPNMSSTGCGFMIRKDFYNEIGGADESYPPMGAIGEEFSVKTWLNGGNVQTRTDVMIGHIFGTGAYDTGGVLEARRRLVADFGDRYDEIYEKFPDFDWDTTMRPTAVHSQERRTVIVDRYDKTTTTGNHGKVIREAKRHYRYVWVDDGTESGLTDDQIRVKYASQGAFVGEEVLIRNDAGEMVDQEIDDLIATPIPPEHYEIDDSEPEMM